MSFTQGDVDALLARTGRMCAICHRPHAVQVHHIVPRHQGGSDEVGNAIPLCPNCHDEVHAGYTPGRTTRRYTEAELRHHLGRTIELAQQQASQRIGDESWKRDADLVMFYAQCLDRPAFRTPFHNELSFADFDRALEDTALALNTGYLRTRDGTTVGRATGKATIVNATWRGHLDDVVGAIDEARTQLRRALGLDRMLMERARDGMHWLDMRDDELRHDGALGHRLDALRQRAVDAMNEVLVEVGVPALKRVGEW